MIAVYVRVSTREQKEGFGIDSQLTYINNYIKNNNLSNVDILYFNDEGYSAGSMNRPALQDLLEQIKKSKITMVIIYKQDRLFRNLRDQHIIMDIFKEKNVYLHCLTNLIDTETAHGRFALTLNGALAEFEREQVSERTLEGLIQSAKEGNYSVGTTPLGYKRVKSNTNKKGKYLVIDPEMAEVIERIFMLKVEGYGVESILKILNDEKTLDRRWHETTLYNILKNRIYYGTFSHFGIEIENHSPAIISKTIWERANSSIQKKALKGTYLFDGTVIHDECEIDCRNQTGTSKYGDPYYYYVCRNCKKYISEKQIFRSFTLAHIEFQKINKSGINKGLITRLKHKKKSLTDLYIRELISESTFIEGTREIDIMLKNEVLKISEPTNAVDYFLNLDRQSSSILIHDLVSEVLVNTTNNWFLFKFSGGVNIVVNDEKVSIL